VYHRTIAFVTILRCYSAAIWHHCSQVTANYSCELNFLRTNQLYIFLFWRRPTTVEEILTIEIKPGWKKGTKITFPEKGNEQRGLIPADLVFIIDEKPHSVFKRDGNDLVVTQKISLVEALTGYTAQIATLDGRNLTVPVNTIISPSYEEVVKGEGMPIPKEPSKKGNLRIKFNVKFPSRLTSEQKTGIKRLLTSS
jgi:DnaJ family protein B protein 4